MLQILTIAQPFPLDCGEILPSLDIAYHTFGTYNPEKNNVVWICHALTANSDPVSWWPGLVGDHTLFNPNDYFIVCANILGSCYGSTGPGSINPSTGAPYGSSFPHITIRDMVRAHQLLRLHLGIESIHLVIGGSLGGQQALEWSCLEPNVISNLAVLATNARHSPWGIAFNTAQRLALEADPTLWESHPNAGGAGLRAARAIAMLSYRNYPTFAATQSDTAGSPAVFRAESYLRYQGEKLVRRFSAQAYWTLTKAMDGHHLGRDRGTLEEVLGSISARCLVIGISSDILFPTDEQRFIANHLPIAEYHEIDSPFGHDGFLIEFKQLHTILSQFLGRK